MRLAIPKEREVAGVPGDVQNDGIDLVISDVLAPFSVGRERTGSEADHRDLRLGSRAGKSLEKLSDGSGRVVVQQRLARALGIAELQPVEGVAVHQLVLVAILADAVDAKETALLVHGLAVDPL